MTRRTWNAISGSQQFVSRPLADRFWEKVQVAGPNDCWIWVASTTKDGYGRIKSHKGGPIRQATHVSWELEHGKPFPPGTQCCHKCDNPRCVNPAHLFIGTNVINQRDAVAKGRNDPSRGTAHVAHKLDDEKIVTIRGLAKTGRTQTSLAAEFGVSQPVIGRIIRRKTWKHVG